MSRNRYTTPEGSEKPWNGFQMSWLTPELQARLRSIVETRSDVDVGAVAYWILTVLPSSTSLQAVWPYILEVAKRHRLSTGTIVALQDVTQDFWRER